MHAFKAEGGERSVTAKESSEEKETKIAGKELASLSKRRQRSNDEAA